MKTRAISRGVCQGLVVGGLLVTAAGCDTEAAAEASTLEVSCDGKCDGLSELKDLMRDPSELSLADLLDVAAPKVFETLSDAVSTKHASISLEAPVFHDADSIQTLSSGLAERFGESELTTEVPIEKHSSG